MVDRKGGRATDRFRKRDAILDASTGILNQRGVKGLTLADAAAAVELSTTSVTYYFKRKDDLAAACMLRGVEWLQTAADEAVRRPDRRRRGCTSCSGSIWSACVSHGRRGLGPAGPVRHPRAQQRRAGPR